MAENERKKFPSLRHFFGERFGGKEPSEGLSELHLKILTTGMQIHSRGIPWWRAVELIDEMRSQGLPVTQRAKAHGGIAELQRSGHLEARWFFEDESNHWRFRVSDLGRGARAKVMQGGSRAILGVPVARRRPI